MVAPHENSGRAERDDSAELFLAAVDDVTPLANRDRVPAATMAGQPAVGQPAPGPSFATSHNGEQITARAPGVNRRTTRDLARGKPSHTASLDLHGHRVERARLALSQFLARSLEDTHRCVLVITGRGKHSAAGPVLRNAVVEWLTGPLSSHVLAVSSAATRDGGSGALYVLLRKSSC